MSRIALIDCLAPWWLVRRERVDDAKHSLGRLLSNGTPEQTEEIIALMQHTNEVEKELAAGTTYWDLFKTPSDRYRTEVVICVWVSPTVQRVHRTS